MKNRRSFAAAIWWILACLIAGVFLMCTSDKEGKISEVENRMLQGFPKLSVQTVINDEFTTGFESHLSDSFFARDDIISFTDGLLGTSRNLFPTRTSGVYTQGESTLFVSRGLGNNTVPIKGFRLFNRPELAVVELTQK